MKNFLESGEVLDYLIPSETTITSGSAVKIGALIGVAVLSGTEGETIAVNLEGVYELPKASGAISAGDSIFYDAGNENFTKTAEGNTYAGIAWRSAQSGDATLYLRLGSGDAGGELTKAAYIAPLGATSNLVGVDGTGSNAAPLAGTEARLDAAEAKLDALIDSLIDAGLMADS